MGEDIAATRAVYQDPNAPLEARVADLFARLSLEEKVALCAGASAFALEPIPRLGVPSLRMTDGPTGVRSIDGAVATVFPVGVAVAASFNPALAGEVAAAIAREAKALGEHVVLAPTVNMVRLPQWGRNFETYAEDPCLAGQIGAAFVRGLQGEGVAASLKHYAVNNQERHRFEVDAQLDERTLREIYLAAFETIVAAANPWTVMAAYNKVNGAFASEHRRLLTDILKGEWGYEGVVVSDWGAVHSTAPAANAGLDLEMPGPARHFGERLLAAVRAGAVSAAQIDDHARRIVRLILRCGLLDGAPARGGELRSPRHRAIARRAAGEGMVLLKNEAGLLPLSPRKIRSLAVIGPNATQFRIQGGGSSRVNPGRRATPLAALEALVGEEIALSFSEGPDNEPVPPLAQGRLFSPTEARDAQGLSVAYFKHADFAGAPFRTALERSPAKWVNLFGDGVREAFAALRWSGWFWPLRDGQHELSFRGDGDVRVWLDDQLIIEPGTPGQDDLADIGGAPALRRTAAVTLEAGRGYPIRIDYVWAPARGGGSFESGSLGVRQPSGTIEAAVATAAAADVALVLVGSASTTEAEGYDRPDIALPGPQDALVRAVAAANPNTVVVVNAGSPMALPWIDQVAAALVAWLPGEEGCEALAEVLFGETAPSGRLPVSFPRRIEDTAAYPYYDEAKAAPYGEGLFIGYRHHDRSGIAPLFPFGHGLTYTRFAYEAIEAPRAAAAGETVLVTVQLSNVGERAGQEVVQLYVAPRAPSVPRPVKELKAFAKLALEPGASGSVSLSLNARDFAFYDPERAAWVTEPGDYDLLVGASAGDIRLSARLSLT